MSREIMVFVEDIFFTAKIRETARVLSRDVRFIRDLAGLDKRLSGPAPGMIIIDLAAESLKPLEIIRRVKEQPEWQQARIVAYASHARAELMEEANQIGADTVLPKSGFTQKLAEILQSAAA
jgi:DNA-binding NarL/FixJ family response regulator